ncbi:ParB N-terminal domain-containing protein [Candidatus Sumerlaeota bacterium]|nr:ParB N-terminal domain-containing protein [Candidatus Sumerlaeota bacterium]
MTELAVDQVELADRAFDLGFARSYEALKRSVGKVGVLQPLVVRRRLSDGRCQIVCGFGRAAAAQQANLATVPAYVLGCETTDFDCLNLALNDNLGHRRVNPIEQAIALTKLGQFVDREHLIADYMELPGMRSSGPLLVRALALMHLTDRLQLAVAEGRMEEKVGAALARLPRDDQERFACLLDVCRPSVSVVREWAEALLDISRRDKRSVSEILGTPDIAAILGSGEITDAQRTSALRHHIHNLRYPTLAQREAQFAKTVSALRLPPSMRLEAAAGFETDEMCLQIRFTNEEQLREAIRIVDRWFDAPSPLGELWQNR